jgi:carbonic anhydrase/acetyltransferase-like protein (isoleucine patch superfamily)
MALYELDGVAPQLAEGAWVADNATVIGDVRLAENASVWFGAVLRGDTEPITLGRGSNIQDGSVVHTDHGLPCTIGANVTVGHQVTLHGCTIGDGALVGIGATVLNGAVIGKNCIVGAGALVTERSEFPEGMLIIGAPAKAVRPLSPEQIERMGRGAPHYVENAQRYARGLKRIDR